MLPMAVDGITHMLSDLWGVTAGFRQSNAWLAVLTGNLLPPTFYAGDAWGSFNSLARLVTGLLAAFGLIFWLLPLVDRSLRRAGSFTTEKNQPQGGVIFMTNYNPGSAVRLAAAAVQRSRRR